MANVNLRTEMTAHIRGRIKNLGIKARVSNCPGSPYAIRVSVPSYEARFTAEEQRSIKHLAASNGLTFVRGLPIDIDRASDEPGQQFSFYLTAETLEQSCALHRKYPSIYSAATPTMMASEVR